MDHYVRGKTWISSQFNEKDLREGASDDGATNYEYSEADKESWRRDPAAYLEYRKSLEQGLQGNYGITQNGSLKSIVGQVRYAENMRERLKTKPEIAELLVPDFPPYCKRITPGPGYLEALTESHVNTIPQAITHVDEEGVITADGTKRPVDAIICATGFDTSPGQGFPIYGRDGINLREKYRIRPKTYLGLCTDNFPNFFQSLGPNTWQGGGSLLIMMEYAHNYMGQILRKLAYGNIKTIEPKRKQVENFTNYCDEYFKRTVFSANCVSWYKTTTAAGEPRVTALWPGSSIHALKVLEAPRWEDFEMEASDGNDFGWFGNGWTMGEKDTGDNKEALTWYLNNTKFLDEPLVPAAPEAIVEQETVQEDSVQSNTTLEASVQEETVQPEAVAQEPVEQESVQQETLQEEPIKSEPAPEEVVRQEAIQQESLPQEPEQQQPADHKVTVQEIVYEGADRPEYVHQEYVQPAISVS